MEVFKELITWTTTEIYVKRDEVREEVKKLLDKGARFITIVAIDRRLMDKVFELLYFFSLDDKREIYVLRTKLPHYSPSINSITPLIPAANWIEREVRDLLGIEFEGHPDPRRLVLPDDWPEGVHPLRKEVPYNVTVYEAEKPYTYIEAKPTEVVLPIGPWHPVLEEPIHVRLYADGEKILDVDYRGFFVHRGIEKLGESKFKIRQLPYLAERICGICGFAHSTCYCQAIERALKIEVPERAEYIRTIMLELERIHSHLLIIGLICHALGFDGAFMHLWRIREGIMDLCEVLTGNRKMYSINTIGGVRWDIEDKHIPLILKEVRRVREELKSIEEFILRNRIYKQRCVGVGVIPKDLARKLCVVGPVARASGIPIDVRKDYPYAAYKYLSFRVPTYTEGDIDARVKVRIEEVYESISIIEQAVDKLPKGPIKVEEERIEFTPGVWGYSLVEAPRGEVFHYVETQEGERLYRWKVRTPTFMNLPTIFYCLKGLTIADAVVFLKSLDPCISCTERIVRVR